MLFVLVRAVPLVLLALAAPTPVIALGAAVAGFGVEIFGVLWETLLQEHVPNDVLSRVAAYDWLGSLVVMPISYAAAGPIADAIGVEETLWAAAALATALTALSLMSFDLRNLQRQTVPSPSG